MLERKKVKNMSENVRIHCSYSEIARSLSISLSLPSHTCCEVLPRPRPPFPLALPLATLFSPLPPFPTFLFFPAPRPPGTPSLALLVPPPNAVEGAAVESVAKGAAVEGIIESSADEGAAEPFRTTKNRSHEFGSISLPSAAAAPFCFCRSWCCCCCSRVTSHARTSLPTSSQKLLQRQWERPHNVYIHQYIIYSYTVPLYHVVENETGMTNETWKKNARAPLIMVLCCTHYYSRDEAVFKVINPTLT